MMGGGCHGHFVGGRPTFTPEWGMSARDGIEAEVRERGLRVREDIPTGAIVAWIVSGVAVLAVLALGAAAILSAFLP